MCEDQLQCLQKGADVVLLFQVQGSRFERTVAPHETLNFFEIVRGLSRLTAPR